MQKDKIIGKEVYSISYDDIGYPESTVRIMSDEILKFIKNSVINII